MFVDLQLGHLMLVDIGLPQFGQFSAASEICLLQSGHVIRGIKFIFLISTLRQHIVVYAPFKKRKYVSLLLVRKPVNF